MRHCNYDVSLKGIGLFNLVFEDRLLARADVRYYHGKLYCLLIEF